VERPVSEDELIAVVQKAAAGGRRVKAVGAGHSFTDCAVTDGTLLDLSHYQKVLAWDPDAMQIRVQAGLTLKKLNGSLAVRDAALTNLGDIAYQTVAGAISTGTHGTGRDYGNLSTQVVALRLITGEGDVLDCSAEEHPEVFAAARVGVGALGLISTVTLQCVPAFRLHAQEKAERLDEVLADWDGFLASADHAELFWVPGTRSAITKRNDRTQDGPRPLPPSTRLQAKLLYDNVAFGAAQRVGRLAPSLLPRALRLIPSTGPLDYTDDSYKVFASPRWVHFLEMEYAIPVEAVPEALGRVRGLVKDLGQPVGFPVEVRAVAADDITLSPASGRATGYIAVHVYRGVPHHAYFGGVERIMGDYGGRPHWGKLHFQTAETLAPRYPGWDAFQSVRARLDAPGTFANAYTDRVFG
jgi:L-gulonolactone oxidase